MRDYMLVIFVLLLAGCPELVSVDDPRSVGGTGGDGGATEHGLCTGSPVWCEDRSQAQCNSGCTIATACRSPMLERCATHRETGTCNTDSACHWSADACKPSAGALCYLDETQLACANDTSETCVWAPACTGSDFAATRCFEIEARADCEANLGCDWIVD